MLFIILSILSLPGSCIVPCDGPPFHTDLHRSYICVCKTNTADKANNQHKKGKQDIVTQIEMN